jgi:hypothetical protein
MAVILMRRKKVLEIQYSGHVLDCTTIKHFTAVVQWHNIHNCFIGLFCLLPLLLDYKSEIFEIQESKKIVVQFQKAQK